MKNKTTLAQAVNQITAHGARIEERLSGLSTIWPTEAELNRADRHADRLNNKALAEAADELEGLEKRTVGGEVRYYKTETVYTPAVKRGGVRRWFEVRAGQRQAEHLGNAGAPRAAAGTSHRKDSRTVHGG